MLDWDDWSYHYPPLGRPGDGASVEIHRDAGEQRRLLPADAARRDALPLPAEGMRLSALSASHRALHAVFNSAVQDRAHKLGNVPLKQLHDLALICEAGGRDIDWEAVCVAFSRCGLAPAFDAHLYLAHQCLDLPMPGAIRPTLRARLHHRRCLAQLTRPGIGAALGRWAALTHPFTRHRVDYLYGVSGNPFSRASHLLHRVWTLWKRHRGRLRQKIDAIHRGFYSSR